jgi:hypothetical protein
MMPCVALGCRLVGVNRGCGLDGRGMARLAAVEKSALPRHGRSAEAGKSEWAGPAVSGDTENSFLQASVGKGVASTV